MTVSFEYTIQGRIPSKKNSRITNRKTGRSFPSKAYTAWEKEAILQIAANDVKLQHPIEKCTRVSLIIYFPCKRKADLTNKAESVMDMLIKAGVLIDDAWQITGPVKLYPQYRKGEGGAEIYIEVEFNGPC